MEEKLQCHKDVTFGLPGKKVYLNPELQKEWDKLINKERSITRQEKICGQADYRRCSGDCFVCPWRKEGIVVSYETEHFQKGSAMTMQRAAMAL